MPRYEYVDDSKTDPSVQTFIDNAIKWLAQKPDKIRIATKSKTPVGKYTEQLKIIAPKDLASQKDINVYFQNAHEHVDEKGVQSILDFVEKGGGLLICGHAWSWKQTGKSLYAYPGNK